MVTLSILLIYIIYILIRDNVQNYKNNFSYMHIELSAFPRIRPHPQGSLNSIYFPSKNSKSGTPQKVLEENFTFNVSNSNNCLPLKRHNTDINVEKNQKELIEKTRQKAITYDNKLQKKYISQEFNKITERELQQNNLNYDTNKKAATFEYKEKNTEESRYG